MSYDYISSNRPGRAIVVLRQGKPLGALHCMHSVPCLSSGPGLGSDRLNTELRRVTPLAAPARRDELLLGHGRVKASLHHLFTNGRENPFRAGRSCPLPVSSRPFYHARTAGRILRRDRGAPGPAGRDGLRGAATLWRPASYQAAPVETARGIAGHDQERSRDHER